MSGRPTASSPRVAGRPSVFVSTTVFRAVIPLVAVVCLILVVSAGGVASDELVPGPTTGEELASGSMTGFHGSSVPAPPPGEAPDQRHVEWAGVEQGIDNPAVIETRSVSEPVFSDAVTCPHRVTGRANSTVESPAIGQLYPNTPLPGNEGEYFVLELPDGVSPTNWSVTDGHTTASIPDGPHPNRVAVSMNPSVTEELTRKPVVELDGYLRLAEAGDELELRDGNGTIDAVRYDDAPAGRVWHRSMNESTGSNRESVAGADVMDATGAWWPRDATCRTSSQVTLDRVTPFVLPDSPSVPLELLQSADERLLLAGYTVTSQTIVDALVAAADRGVEVSVLFESGPVGGVPADTEPLIETLVREDVDVRAVGGPGARYRFHHPKYAVADDAVLVTSENWNPSGVGGTSSRGWGIQFEDERLADDLAAIFEADFAGWDTTDGATVLETATFVEDDSPTDQFPTAFESATVAVDSIELVVAPDNAAPRLRSHIQSAETELLIKQARIGDSNFVLLDESVEAARRGVEVRVLLDSSWYVEEDNEAIRLYLERIADEEDLPIEVRLVDPGMRFEKIHAKGVVIDGQTAIVGSLNWNDNSLYNNREVVVVAHGSQVASFYATVFEDDWVNSEGFGIDVWLVPIELAAVVVCSLAAAAYVGHKYVRFGVPPVEFTEEDDLDRFR